jgi:hypothetical protein
VINPLNSLEVRERRGGFCEEGVRKRLQLTFEIWECMPDTLKIPYKFNV